MDIPVLISLIGAMAFFIILSLLILLHYKLSFGSFLAFASCLCVVAFIAYGLDVQCASVEFVYCGD